MGTSCAIIGSVSTGIAVDPMSSSLPIIEVCKQTENAEGDVSAKATAAGASVTRRAIA
jgi:hypothetical protein